MSASAERLATLLAATDAETPYGGRMPSWSPVAILWVALTPSAIDRATASDAPSVDIQAATAVARDHPAALVGQQLVLPGEPPFLIHDLRRAAPAPGRMTLTLERLL